MKSKTEIREQIENAEMLLIGLGEEFDNVRLFGKEERYQRTRKRMEEGDIEWMIPAYQDLLRREKNDPLGELLQNFSRLIGEKNYFVVSTSTNSVISLTPWREGRLVMPCGNGRRKQCAHGCAEAVSDLTGEEEKRLRGFLLSLEKGEATPQEGRALLGTCPVCGEPLILNNIYTGAYDEKGYLEQWGGYTRWLQGTLNRGLLVLELGVGLQCPTVIRFPFEKITFYNQKAFLYRVNETLYQLTENLREKGCPISENSVDWLQFLC